MKETKSHDFTVVIPIKGDAMKAFDAINNVRGWWTDGLTGNTTEINDEFTVRFGDVHMSTQRITESVPGKRVSWLVTESALNFISDKQEWSGTKVVFEIIEVGGKTQIKFTHVGLRPDVECYDACSNAWTGYLQDSLRALADTGRGKPTVSS